MKPAAGPSILAAALIVAFVWLALLSPALALADELPNDTNQIERLTPEQAKKLAAEFPGVTVSERVESMTSCTPGCLPLNGLKSLDADAAKALIEKERWHVEWDGSMTVPTPCVEGDRVFVAGMHDLLVCLEVATGKIVWRTLDDGGGMNGADAADSRYSPAACIIPCDPLFEERVRRHPTLR